MPRERSLLERLRDPGAEGPRTIHENTNRLAQSVMANLRRLLNSHPGIAPAMLDYGIPDMTEVLYSMPESQAKMRAAIKTAIEKYEPRLRRVAVKPVPRTIDTFLLSFEITAELVTSEEKASVRFETRIDPSGKAEIRD